MEETTIIRIQCFQHLEILESRKVQIRMRTVEIKPDTNGDSRVASKVPTFEEFMKANQSHISDVKDMTNAFAQELVFRIDSHDHTKVTEPYCSMFYRDLCNTIEGRMKFFDGEWSKIHYEELERHHLNRFCPEDVDIFDVIEMIIDCVCAGAARSGSKDKIYDPVIPEEILTKAVKNTVEYLKDNIEIKSK